MTPLYFFITMDTTMAENTHEMIRSMGDVSSLMIKQSMELDMLHSKEPTVAGLLSSGFYEFQDLAETQKTFGFNVKDRVMGLVEPHTSPLMASWYLNYETIEALNFEMTENHKKSLEYYTKEKDKHSAVFTVLYKMYEVYAYATYVLIADLVFDETVEIPFVKHKDVFICRYNLGVCKEWLSFETFYNDVISLPNFDRFKEDQLLDAETASDAQIEKYKNDGGFVLTGMYYNTNRLDKEHSMFLSTKEISLYRDSEEQGIVKLTDSSHLIPPVYTFKSDLVKDPTELVLSWPVVRTIIDEEDVETITDKNFYAVSSVVDNDIDGKRLRLLPSTGNVTGETLTNFYY